MKPIIIATLAMALGLCSCSKEEAPKTDDKPAAAAPPAAPPPPAAPAPSAAAAAAAAITPDKADEVAAALEKEIEEDLAKE